MHPASSKRKAIVLITIDCLRYDYVNEILNILPHNWGKIVFHRHYANAPYTWASFPSIFTSLPYSLYKLLYLDKVRPVTVMKILRKQGYYTIGYISVNEFLRDYFNEFDECISRKSNDFFYGPTKQRGYLRAISKKVSMIIKSKRPILLMEIVRYLQALYTIFDFVANNFHSTRYLEYPPIDSLKETSTILKYLSNRLRKYSKIFVWIHYMDLHMPYNVSIRKSQSAINNLKIITYMVFPPQSLIHYNSDIIRSSYELSLKHLLRSLKKLMLFIENSFDEVFFIITSDHGEEFLEHGGLGHLGINYGAKSYPHLYEENIHVPLVITSPEMNVNLEIDNILTTHLDIAPTILGISGGAHDATKPKHKCKLFLGKDLLRIINYAEIKNTTHTKSARALQYINSDHAIAESDGIIFHAGGNSGKALAIIKYARGSLFKYIYSPILGEELYNLDVDKEEQFNLVHDLPEVVREFRKVLRDYLKFLKRAKVKYKARLVSLDPRLRWRYH